MLGIRRYLQFDSPLLRFLGRLAHASSALGSASALSDSNPGAAVLFAFHHTYHPSCSHFRRGGRRQPHSCTVFAVAARHFSPFPFALLRVCAYGSVAALTVSMIL